MRLGTIAKEQLECVFVEILYTYIVIPRQSENLEYLRDMVVVFGIECVCGIVICYSNGSFWFRMRHSWFSRYTTAPGNMFIP
jgi:hypothetical protein